MSETTVYPSNIDYPSNQFKENKLGASVTAILLSTALIAGTGSVCAIRNVNNNINFTGQPLITIIDRDRKSRASNIAQIQMQLLRIRNSFGLNMSELARVFGVSRQAIYSWFQGAEPRPDALARIWAMDEHAKSIEALAIPRISSLLRRPILDGRNLFDLLIANEFVEEGIARIHQIVDEDRRQAPQIRAKRIGRPRIHDVQDVSNVLS